MISEIWSSIGEFFRDKKGDISQDTDKVLSKKNEIKTDKETIEDDGKINEQKDTKQFDPDKLVEKYDPSVKENVKLKDFNPDDLVEPAKIVDISRNKEGEFVDNNKNSVDAAEGEKIQQEDVRYKNCPVENGKWEGERGDSKWIPDENYVPEKSNPDEKTWKEILDKYGIDGINFKDGEPDFSEISKGDVKIDNFTDNRSDNFDQADMKEAEKRGCSPEEVAKWRKDNKYTWHECRDMETMQKVPSEVHNNITHRGGISAKKGEM